MNIIGVDVGKEGAFTILEVDAEFKVKRAAFLPTPFDEQIGFTDVGKLLSWLAEKSFLLNGQDTHIFVEQVHSFPRQGVVSTFTFGIRYGEVLGLCNTLKAIASDNDVPLGVHLVPAGVWSKEITKAFISDKKARKQANYNTACTLYPTLEKSFYKTKKSRVFHTGIVDSLLIAEYGRRAVKGETVKDFSEEINNTPITKLLLENGKTVDLKWVIKKIRKETDRISSGILKIKKETPKAIIKLRMFKQKLKWIVKTLDAAEKAYDIAKTGVKYMRNNKPIKEDI